MPRSLTITVTLRFRGELTGVMSTSPCSHGTAGFSCYDRHHCHPFVADASQMRAKGRFTGRINLAPLGWWEVRGGTTTPPTADYYQAVDFPPTHFTRLPSAMVTNFALRKKPRGYHMLIGSGAYWTYMVFIRMFKARCMLPGRAPRHFC